MCKNKQTISIVRATTNTFTLNVTDENGDAFALTGGQVFRFGVKTLPGDTQYLISKTITGADSDGAGGYLFTLDPSDTKSLPFGSYWYDVGMQDGTQYFNVIPASPFEIKYNVTEANQ